MDSVQKNRAVYLKMKKVLDRDRPIGYTVVRWLGNKGKKMADLTLNCNSYSVAAAVVGFLVVVSVVFTGLTVIL